MIDVEKKSYQYIENNLDHLEQALRNYDLIVQTVFQNNEQTEWSRIQSLEQFIRITISLLQKGRIFDAVCAFKVTHEVAPNSDVGVFYALVERLEVFVKRIFDLFLLDQYLFLLTKISDETLTYENLSHPFSTGSYYEKNYFDLPYFQVGLDISQAMNRFDQEMYFIKESYQKEIASLLTNSIYRFKRARIDELLQKFMMEHKETPYLDVFYLSTHTLVEVPKFKEASVPKVESDPDQISFFR